MKTPKEILLQRHQGIEFKLNAVRNKALAALTQPRWQEFILSARWHLAGMGAIWMAVLLFHLSTPSDSDVVVARAEIPPARVLVESLLNNRRELMQLTEAPLPAEPAAPPRRSQVQQVTEMV